MERLCSGTAPGSVLLELMEGTGGSGGSGGSCQSARLGLPRDSGEATGGSYVFEGS